MGPSWHQRPRTFAPQASAMAAGVRDDVGYEYTCFMRGGEDARLHGRLSQLVASFGNLSKALKEWKNTKRRGIRASTAHRPANVAIPRITVSYDGSKSHTFFSAHCARLMRSPSL